MVVQIANPTVVRKVEQLAVATGLSKTRAVEKAVDLMLATTSSPAAVPGRIEAILRQIDAIPDQPTVGPDPLEWDRDGLPA
jgi:antitoxin VapB